MVFKGAVATGDGFRAFCSSYANHMRKRKLIQKGELALSKVLRRVSFRMSALCKCKKVCAENPDYLERHQHRVCGGRHLNPMHHLRELLIRNYGCPFVKVELLRDDPEGSLPDGRWGACTVCPKSRTMTSP